MHNTVVFPILTAGFLFLGIVFTGLGIVFKSVFTKKAEACTAQTTAVVEEINREVNLSTGIDSYRSWFPVFSYKANNRKITVRSKIGHEKKIFEKGQKVTLFYNPDNVREYYVPEENASALTKLFLIMGISFAALGILCILLMRTFS